MCKSLSIPAKKQTFTERQFVRAQDNEGNSALHIAVMNGRYEVFHYLQCEMYLIATYYNIHFWTFL